MNNLNEQEHDITKKMIDVMRNNDQSIARGTMQLDEHDVTKKMIDAIRGGKMLIREVDEVGNQAPMAGNQAGPAGQAQPQSTEPSEAEDLSPDMLKQEEKAFMDSVSPKVNFGEFKIYRKERNVVFSGAFQDLNGLEWDMSLKDSDGLTITAQSLKLDKDSIAIMNKLHGFYLNWSKEWAVKLNTEYKYTE